MDMSTVGLRVSAAEEALRVMLCVWKSEFRHSIALKNSTDSLIEFTVTFWQTQPDTNSRVTVFFIVYITRTPLVFSFQVEGSNFVYHIPGSHSYDKNIDGLIKDNILFKNRLRDAFIPQIAANEFTTNRINGSFKLSQYQLSSLYDETSSSSDQVSTTSSLGRMERDTCNTAISGVTNQTPQTDSFANNLDHEDLSLFLRLEHWLNTIEKSISKDQKQISALDFMQSIHCILRMTLSYKHLDKLYINFQNCKMTKFDEFTATAFEQVQKCMNNNDSMSSKLKYENEEKFAILYAAEHNVTRDKLYNIIIDIFYGDKESSLSQNECIYGTQHGRVLSKEQMSNQLHQSILYLTPREIKEWLFQLHVKDDDDDDDGVAGIFEFMQSFYSMLYRRHHDDYTHSGAKHIKQHLYEILQHKDQESSGKIAIREIRKILEREDLKVCLSRAQITIILSENAKFEDNTDLIQYQEFISSAESVITNMNNIDTMSARVLAIDNLSKHSDMKDDKINVHIQLQKLNTLLEKHNNDDEINYSDFCAILFSSLESTQLTVLLSYTELQENDRINLREFLKQAEIVFSHLNMEKIIRSQMQINS